MAAGFVVLMVFAVSLNGQVVAGPAGAASTAPYKTEKACKENIKKSVDEIIKSVKADKKEITVSHVTNCVTIEDAQAVLTTLAIAQRALRQQGMPAPKPEDKKNDI